MGGLVSQKLFQHWYVFLVLTGTLAVVAASLAVWMHRNIVRESQLQFHVEFSMYQIEKLLGFIRRYPMSGNGTQMSHSSSARSTGTRTFERQTKTDTAKEDRTQKPLGSARGLLSQGS